MGGGATSEARAVVACAQPIVAAAWLVVAAFGCHRYLFLEVDLPCDPWLCERAEPATDLVVLLVLPLLSVQVSPFAHRINWLEIGNSHSGESV